MNYMNSGVHSYPDGSHYEGQWLNGMRHGHGIWSKSDGSTYVGEWENDKPNGQGTLTLPNGKKYSGKWKDGRRHGSGVEIHPDGTKSFGEWENGKLLAETRPETERKLQNIEPEIIKYDYMNEPVEIKRRQANKTQHETRTDPPSVREKQHFISSKSKQSQRKLSRKKSIVWPVLLIVTILGLAAIVFTLTKGGKTYSAAGQVVNYKGEGLADVTIDFGDKFGTINTDEDGYWSTSNLQGDVIVTPSYGNALFNPIRNEISKAENEVNFTLLKEMGKGITTSEGVYIFSSSLTAAEEVELTVIVEDYESGEKLEGIDVEVVVDGATVELFLQDTKGEYLPGILVFDMDYLENYPGVEVREGSLILLIKAALLAKPYLEWAIENPREASAVAALGVAVGLDAYGLVSYTAGGIAIATGAGTLPGAGVIATGFASTLASEFLKVYAESVFANKKQVEHSLTIYIFESRNSVQHKKIAVSAGATTDEIVEAIESEVGNREFSIEMPEKNPTGAYYNVDGTPKFIYVYLKTPELQASTMVLNDLSIGDRIVDNSWQWEFRTGDDYTYQPGDVTKPVVWIVVAKDHYGPGTGVTLLAEETIGSFVFDNSTERGHVHDWHGYNHWGDSGKVNASRGLRPWLNSNGIHSEEGFYRAFSEKIIKAIVTTTIPNKNWKNGDPYDTKDNIFIPSITELGGTLNGDYQIGTVYPYFAEINSSNYVVGYNENVAFSNQWYWTRTVSPYDGHIVRLGSFGNHLFRTGFNEVPFSSDAYLSAGVRPALNIKADTLVYTIPNDDGIYEISWVNNTPTETIALEESTLTYSVVVNVDVLSLRSGPSTDHDILDRLHRGTVLRVIDEKNEWLKVITPDGKDGWVAAEYLLAKDSVVELDRERDKTASYDPKEPFAVKDAYWFVGYIRLDFGMEIQEVISLLGEPQDVIYRDSDWPSLELIYPELELVFLFHPEISDEVGSEKYFPLSMSTNSPLVSGPRNIKVGDSIESVLSKFPDENNPINPITTLDNGEENEKYLRLLYGRDPYEAPIGYIYYDKNQNPLRMRLTNYPYNYLSLYFKDGIITNIHLYIQVT